MPALDKEVSETKREGKEETYAELKVLGTGRDDGDFLGC